MANADMGLNKAAECPDFSFDCEDECEDDEIHCRNCRYRRWTRDSFICAKEKNE